MLFICEQWSNSASYTCCKKSNAIKLFVYFSEQSAKPSFDLCANAGREVVFGHHPLPTSLSARRVLSPPETDRLLLRDQGSGTVCQMTLQLLHLCRCFDEN